MTFNCNVLISLGNITCIKDFWWWWDFFLMFVLFYVCIKRTFFLMLLTVLSLAFFFWVKLHLEITGFSALAKQLLQTTLLVLFPHFSEKRSAKIMMKGAHYKAKMNTYPTFRRNFRQTCTWASMQNGNLSAFYWWFDDTKVKVRLFLGFCISTCPVVVKISCNLIGENQKRTAEKGSTVVSAESWNQAVQTSCQLKFRKSIKYTVMGEKNSAKTQK